MSYTPDLPPDADVPPGLPDRPADIDASGVRKRAQVPAVLLIVVGVLNLLMALWPAYQGVQVSRITPEQLAQIEEQTEKNMKKDPEQSKQWEELKKQGYSVASFLRWGIVFFFSWAGVDALAAVLTILGGVRMWALKSYALAVFAAILAAIPFVSCSGCFLLGEAVGLWALIVLMNADVRAAFR
jgi:hypothetical protein